MTSRIVIGCLSVEALIMATTLMVWLMADDRRGKPWEAALGWYFGIHAVIAFFGIVGAAIVGLDYAFSGSI